MFVADAHLRASEEVELAEFCRREHPRLLGALVLYTGDRQLAEELAQDTLVRVVTHWKRVSRMEYPSAWAFRVATNLANSTVRRAMARRRAMSRLEARTSDESDDHDHAAAVALRAVVGALPERQRTALVLRYFADLPVADIAAVMRCKEGTVGALVHQAIAALRRCPEFEGIEAE
jgi:RNA polymerase sigma factor (sigma-70 family)